MNVATKINNWLRTATAHFQSSSRERGREFQSSKRHCTGSKVFMDFFGIHNSSRMNPQQRISINQLCRKLGYKTLLKEEKRFDCNF